MAIHYLVVSTMTLLMCILYQSSVLQLTVISPFIDTFPAILRSNGMSPKFSHKSSLMLPGSSWLSHCLSGSYIVSFFFLLLLDNLFSFMVQ